VPPAASPSGFAIYTRQSVDTAKDFSSCDAQFQTCLDCARAFGDRDADWIGERFDDQGWPPRSRFASARSGCDENPRRSRRPLG